MSQLCQTHRFNPRARDGREIMMIDDWELYDVSIHAPVMDAKAVTGVQVIAKRVSIHAPVMDAKSRITSSQARY